MVRADYRPYWLYLLSFYTLILLSSTARSQITSVDDTTSTPIPGAGHDYIHLLSETVNPANGSVSLRFNIPVPKARGITIPFSFSYDSNSVNHLVGGVPNPGVARWLSNTSGLSQGGWSFSLPIVSAANYTETWQMYPNNLNCSDSSNYVFSDPSGGQHSLGLASQHYQSGGPPGVSDYFCPYSGNSVRTGGDPVVVATLPAIYTDPDNPTAPALTPLNVFTGDGTVYTFPFNKSLTYSFPSTIEDRNGNIVNVTDNGMGSFTIQDTAGRAAVSSNGFGPSGSTNTLTIGGLAYQVVWTTITANFSAPAQNALGSTGTSGECQGLPPGSTTQTVVSQIILPNLQSYQFHYGTDNSNQAFQNPYGLLNKIVYPDGGWVQYSWKWADQMNQFLNFPGSINVVCGDGSGGCTAPVLDACLFQYSVPVVNQRQVGFTSSTTPVLTQSFTTYSTNWSTTGTPPGTAWTSKGTTVSTTDNVRNQTQTTTYSYSPYTTGNNDPLHPYQYLPQIPLEQTVKYYGFDGALLKTVNKTWNGPYQLASEQAILENGLSSQAAYRYGSYSQVTEKDEYDFGQSAPSRITRTAYEVFIGAHGKIADRPCKTVVYNGSGKPFSETDYLYDGGAAICGNPGTPTVTNAGGNSLTGHDETNFGVGSSVSRGNLTTKVERESTGPSPTTTYTYDETGQATTVTDPNGNVTQYSYADQFVSTNTGGYTTTAGSPPTGTVTNAYLTKMTRPATSTNHISQYTYGYNDGELTTSIDENTPPNTTTYRYNDLLDRLTETDYPDNGQTTLLYTDAPPNPSMTTTKKLTSTTSIISAQVLDGMGHPVQAQLTDPEGLTTSETAYTGTGWVLSSTNAHRSGSSATDGTTTFTYDGLGRTKAVTEPDGSSIQTAYATSCTPNTNVYGVTVTDEAGRSRTTCSDGLGRMTSVFENPSGLNYETDYQYDVLNSLLNVTQKGGSSQANWRTRSFAYDWLSRLISATNPESGTVLYSYDPNGNVTQKTDARGIRTTMKYDALNRLTSKSYSDGTPTATFYYDTSPAPWGPGIKNTNGRLVEATTGITPEP